MRKTKTLQLVILLLAVVGFLLSLVLPMAPNYNELILSATEGMEGELIYKYVDFYNGTDKAPGDVYIVNKKDTNIIVTKLNPHYSVIGSKIKKYTKNSQWIIDLSDASLMFYDNNSLNGEKISFAQNGYAIEEILQSYIYATPKSHYLYWGVTESLNDITLNQGVVTEKLNIDGQDIMFFIFHSNERWDL